MSPYWNIIVTAFLWGSVFNAVCNVIQHLYWVRYRDSELLKIEHRTDAFTQLTVAVMLAIIAIL